MKQADILDSIIEFIPSIHNNLAPDSKWHKF